MEKNKLKDSGLKVTVPRVKLLELLSRKENRHMSAEELYKSLIAQGDDVGLATVYRVLSQFEAVGLVEKHYFEGGYCVYELKRDEHHDHLVCIECGRVEEFRDDIIEKRQIQVAKKLGFKIVDHSLNLYGNCSKCLK